MVNNNKNKVHDNGINLPIPVTYIRDIILMCTENIRFIFREKAYKQIDGVAMESPPPLLADIFMSTLEKQMQRMLGEFMLYKRCVDDTLIIGNNNSKSLENFITLFNNIHPNIRVTSELESNNKLGDGTIQRSIFR
ncbi:unnamed protein product [Trichobilharzia regenti]|nr:unnamed protein product [Trichobilharzia regenti]